MGRKALVPGKVTPRPCPGPGGVRTGNWLLPPSLQHGAGDTLFRIIGEERQNSWSPCKSRGWLHSQAPLLSCQKHLQVLGTPQGALLPMLLPTTGTCQDLPDLLYSLVLFRRGRQRWPGGLPDSQHLQERLSGEAALGAVSRWQVANTEHSCELWLMGTGTLCHGLKTTLDVAAASPFAPVLHFHLGCK